MARRDNQGIQIAMIVFILTTLLFMVTTYLFYNSTTSLQGKLESAESNLSSARSAASSAEQLATSLKTAIGVAPSSDDATTNQEVQAALGATGQGLSEENRNFKDILDTANQRIAGLSNDLTQANQTIAQLRRQLQSEQDSHQVSLKNASDEVAKSKESYTQILTQYQDYKAQKDSNETNLVARASSAEQRARQAETKATSDIQAAAEREALARTLLQRRSDELNLMRQDTPDQYDGAVLGVEAARRTVWLDIGSADGLRPKTTFNVYDADDTNVRTADKKASLEVVKVIGPHRSMAKVTSTDYVTPIFAGDRVYSAIWSPGTRLGVALVGVMDIDNNGTDDRAYVRNLIRLNGGQVDAEDVDGQQQGQMSVETRYIVVGDSKKDGSTSIMDVMMREAQTYAIEKMSLQEMLDLMGYAGRARSISFAGDAAPADFAAKPRGDVNRASTGSNSFRRRVPTPRRQQLPNNN